MTDVVLRNRALPNQPVVVPLPDDGELSPEYGRAGWYIAKTDPEKIPTPPTVDPADVEPAPETAPAVE